MKIQTYNSQAKRTDKIASQQIKVQANSAVFEKAGVDFAAAGKQGADILSTWALEENKLVVDAEAAQASRDFKEQIQIIATKIDSDPALNANPTAAANQLKNMIRSIVTTTTSKMKSPAAKKMFAASSRTAASTLGLGVRKAARKRLVSTHIAQASARGSQLEQEIAAASEYPNSANHLDLKEKLYGDPTDPAKPGIYKELVRKGFLTAVQGQKQELKSLSRVATGIINKEFLKASIELNSGNPMRMGVAVKAYAKIAQDLADPKKYPDLDNLTRIKLTEQAIIASNSAMRRRVSDDRKITADEKKKRTKKHREIFTETLVAIINSRNGSKVAPPTAEKLVQLLANDDISDTQYDKLTDAINDSRDADVTDPQFLQEITTALFEADNKNDIDKVMRRALNQTGPGKKLRYGAFNNLQSTARGITTPRSRRVKIYRKMLLQAAKAGGPLQKLLKNFKGGNYDNTVFKFDLKLQDPRVNPLEVFEEAIEEITEKQRVNLKQLPKPNFSPMVPPTVSMPNLKKEDGSYSGALPSAVTSELVPKPIEEWTIEDVTYSRNKARSEFKGLLGALAIEIFNLAIIEKYIEDKKPASADQVEKAIKKAEDFKELKDRQSN